MLETGTLEGDSKVELLSGERESLYWSRLPEKVNKFVKENLAHAKLMFSLDCTSDSRCRYGRLMKAHEPLTNNAYDDQARA